MALTPADQHSFMAELFEEDPDRCVHVVDMTSGLAGVRVTGPSAEQLLAAVSELDSSASSFGDMRCAQASFAEIHGTLLRMDLSGVPSYQLFFAREFGEYLWDALMEAGAGVRCVRP